ncbi:hypothetical protein QFZ79_000589 [Arthrobacter sp. V4I6]|uniref:DUF6707 family protein n=1 Tax=unclassified Arthrobacter TaxID=235627 RepID=UPI0027899603|nr:MULTISPECIES: DUF6707 family protein [unclassified Arthrobacter]MDQ0822849.1 hypothetical protein [Arthrobacter sp. V1I7]MDQ0852478.1 hypothetical protein [Arthrobacter sp. V4I6]
MTHPPASRNYSEQPAGSLQTGHHLLLPDGKRSAEIQRVDVETDDFGTPALVLATLTGGGMLRIAAGSAVSVLDAPEHAAEVPARGDIPDFGVTAREDGAGKPPPRGTSPDVDNGTGRGGAGKEDAAEGATPDPAAETPGAPPAPPAVVVPPLPAGPPAASGPSEADLALIPSPEGTPESVVEAAAAAHPDAVGVQLLAERPVKGINTKSGSCLKDLSDLAHELFILRKDAENALAVADLLNVLPFDGNPGRWASVESALALSSYICRRLGQEERATVYERLLRTPDTMETDPFKARINAKVRQRSLNEPNLYDKEIFRSIDSSNPDAEREWRLLRLEALLFLRAHGGSETIGAQELERRIGNELESVRA